MKVRSTFQNVTEEKSIWVQVRTWCVVVPSEQLNDCWDLQCPMVSTGYNSMCRSHAAWHSSHYLVYPCIHHTMVTQESLSWSWMNNSHPFRTLSISHPIPAIRLFQTLILKLQGEGHGVVKEQSRSVSPVSNWFASFLLHINQTNNSWDTYTAISKFDLEQSKIKSLVRSRIKVT